MPLPENPIHTPISRRHGATPEAQRLIQDWTAPSPQGATPVLSGRNTTGSRPSRRHGATPSHIVVTNIQQLSSPQARGYTVTFAR